MQISTERCFQNYSDISFGFPAEIIFTWTTCSFDELVFVVHTEVRVRKKVCAANPKFLSELWTENRIFSNPDWSLASSNRRFSISDVSCVKNEWVNLFYCTDSIAFSYYLNRGYTQIRFNITMVTQKKITLIIKFYTRIESFGFHLIYSPVLK